MSSRPPPLLIRLFRPPCAPARRPPPASACSLPSSAQSLLRTNTAIPLIFARRILPRNPALRLPRIDLHIARSFLARFVDGQQRPARFALSTAQGTDWLKLLLSPASPRRLLGAIHVLQRRPIARLPCRPLLVLTPTRVDLRAPSRSLSTSVKVRRCPARIDTNFNSANASKPRP